MFNFNKVQKKITKLQEIVDDYNHNLVNSIESKDYYESDLNEKSFLIQEVKANTEDDSSVVQIWAEIIPEWASYQLQFNAIDANDILDLVNEYYGEMSERRPKNAFKTPVKVKITGYDFLTNSIIPFSDIEQVKEYVKD